MISNDYEIIEEVTADESANISNAYARYDRKSVCRKQSANPLLRNKGKRKIKLFDIPEGHPEAISYEVVLEMSEVVGLHKD